MAETPIKPEFGEVAKPDNLTFGTRISGTISPYLDLLATTDTVLQARGGIENLEVYRELLRDDQVRSCLQQRRLAVISRPWSVEPGAENDARAQEAADALTEELHSLRWDDITEKALFTIFYGWGVGEVMWRPGDDRIHIGDIKVRERSRFRFGHSGALYLMRNGGTIETMPERKFWTLNTGADNHDEQYGLGLAHSLYWPVFFKRNDIKFWLVFLERFGQPTAIAKLPAGRMDDPNLVKQAVETLQSISTDAGIVVPDNVVIELLEAARSGAADYAGMKEAMDNAIAKVILSQTASTEGTPGKLGSDDTQKSVRDEVVKADADLICESFNRTVVRWWSEWNFPEVAPPRVYRQITPDEDLNDRAERDGKISALGYEPTEQYITETYGEGWVKKAQPEQPPAVRGAIPAQPGDNENFAESAAMATLMAARRGDQDALVEAAAKFAADYKTIMGRRVAALLDGLQFSEDAETFRRRLDEMLAEDPPPETTEKLVRASMFSRMMGAFRAQRRDA